MTDPHDALLDALNLILMLHQFHLEGEPEALQLWLPFDGLGPSFGARRRPPKE
jgi:hypothetical protein